MVFRESNFCDAMSIVWLICVVFASTIRFYIDVSCNETISEQVSPLSCHIFADVNQRQESRFTYTHFYVYQKNQHRHIFDSRAYVSACRCTCKLDQLQPIDEHFRVCLFALAILQFTVSKTGLFRDKQKEL